LGSFVLRAIPPFNPPSRPSATACGFFPTSGIGFRLYRLARCELDDFCRELVRVAGHALAAYHALKYRTVLATFKSGHVSNCTSAGILGQIAYAS